MHVHVYIQSLVCEALDRSPKNAPWSSISALLPHPIPPYLLLSQHRNTAAAAAKELIKMARKSAVMNG